MPDTKRDLSIGEAAAHLGVARRTLIAWADAGLVRHWRTVGGWRRFDADDLDRFKAERSSIQEGAA